MNSLFNHPSPQFGTAEYGASPTAENCQFCHQPIAGTYYRVRAAMACPLCTDRIRDAMSTSTSSKYPTALAYGIGAAILGTALYATFTILTGWIASYVSLAVAWMVGTAIKKGSGGAGGRSCQITAALLTYAAISMASLPITLYNTSPHQRAVQRIRAMQRSRQPETPLTPEQQVAKEQQLAAEQRLLEDEFGQQHANRPTLRVRPNAAQPAPSIPLPTHPPLQAGPAPQAKRFSTSVLLLGLLWLTLGSPFALFWVKGSTSLAVINLLVLAIGVFYAWHISRGESLVIYGPFDAPAPRT